MNRGISQAAPELALIIGAFRYSCKTDPQYWPRRSMSGPERHLG
jgi:hypothetical protein